MYYQEEADKKERRKIIAVATAAVALILILLVAIIVVATKKARPVVTSEGENTSFEISENTEDTESTNTTSTEETVETEDVIVAGFSTETETSEAKDEVKEEAAATESAATVGNADSVVDTGPEEILPLALVAGTLTTYLYSAKLAKENQ